MTISRYLSNFASGVFASGGVSIGSLNDPGAGSLSISNSLSCGSFTSSGQMQIKSGNIFLILNSDNTNYYYINNPGSTGSSNGILSFTQGGVGERMRLTPNGGLSIGTTIDSGAGNLYANGTIRTGGYTVATLPTGATGARSYVTNALAPTFGATVAGGGTVTIPVFYNGTNWIVG